MVVYAIAASFFMGVVIGVVFRRSEEGREALFYLHAFLAFRWFFKARTEEEVRHYLESLKRQLAFYYEFLDKDMAEIRADPNARPFEMDIHTMHVEQYQKKLDYALALAFLNGYGKVARAYAT
jgi:hypothetical protein